LQDRFTTNINQQSIKINVKSCNIVKVKARLALKGAVKVRRD
jgi:hypothetical protein